MKQWVIDTWVLAKCNDISSKEFLGCIGFMTMILENGIVCIDHETEILKEYYRHIRNPSYVSKWWERITRERHLAFFSNKLPNKHKSHLLRVLHFDKDDIKFVGVAYKTSDKLLVSGEDDYSQGVCDYISKELNVYVVSPEEARSLP